MFSSRGRPSRNQYLVIDEPQDEPDRRQSSGNGSVFPYSRSNGASGLTREGAPLLSEGAPPPACTTFPPDVEATGPMVMASSSDDAHRWDHIHDLDEFFRRLYEYHQGGGYACLFWSAIWTLFQFVFIVFVSTFFLQCIDYDILFNNKPVNASDPMIRKRYFGDAMVHDCASHFHPFIIICILIAVLYWIFSVIRTMVYLLRLKEIQLFFDNALRITDSELPNVTWGMVVDAVCKAQSKHHFLVHQDSISSIDLCHRILRYKNYVVAMVNQGLLPPLVKLPFVGEFHYMPEQLKLNLEWLFFWGFVSPFKGSYTLSEEYKTDEKLEELAEAMEKNVMYAGIVNLILSPLAFLYHVFYYIFTAADLTKRDSGALGNRAYTNYGRYRVRHMNELEHELKGRLNRSHMYATQYVAQFSSPLIVVFARNISFVAAAIFFPLTILSVWDEDVLQIEHVLTVLTACGAIALVCRSIIPDENLVWHPHELLQEVTSHLCYVPDHWKERAHDQHVVKEFESIFRLRALNLLEEISAPIITPFVLLFHVRPACRSLLSFIADNTVSLEGIGDVCSFALLDVARHGDPSYQPKPTELLEKKEIIRNPTGEQAQNGLTEMSAIQFAIRHKDWKPPPATAEFMQNLRTRIDREAMSMATGTGGQVLAQSIHALTALPMPGSLFPVGRSILSRPLAPLGTLVEAGIREGGALESSLRQSGQESVVDTLRERPDAEMRVSSLFLRGLRAEKRKPVYASMGPADHTAFIMPNLNQSILHEEKDGDMLNEEEGEEADDDGPLMSFNA